MKLLLSRLLNNETLSECEARELMLAITAGECNEAQLAALLAIFQMRGVRVEELMGFRSALLERRVPVDLSEFNPVDIVGTGGDGKNTFNISTCACFVVAGAGYKVAKHGNYGASSVSGASNVIEAHGVSFSASPDRLKKSIEGCNMAYLHAPLFNSGMKFAAPVRRQLQVRTVFNLLGPLVNPCLPKRQLLGVADLKQMRLYVNTFRKLGMEFAVVTSLDGYDEISLTDKFMVVSDRYQMVRKPSDIGLTSASAADLFGGNTPAEAAKIFDDVLQGHSSKCRRDCVVANAAFAIQLFEPQLSIEECVAIAGESLDSGKAFSSLKKFVELNS